MIAHEPPGELLDGSQVVVDGLLRFLLLAFEFGQASQHVAGGYLSNESKAAIGDNVSDSCADHLAMLLGIASVAERLHEFFQMLDQWSPRVLVVW